MQMRRILRTLGDRVRYARELRLLSGNQLSKVAGLSRAHVGMIERGDVEDPAGSTVQKLAEALGVDADWLLTGHGLGPRAYRCNGTDG